MAENEWLAQRFESQRSRLRGVAYRMLGSKSEADDAVQEAWLRLSRADAGDVENLEGWLTTVVARISLDMLRSRKARPEEPVGAEVPDAVANRAASANDPEDEAALADSVGLALLVVLDMLAPAERLAFVLHDMFALPFEEIAPIVGRSLAATRQLASRARRRVQGAPAPADPERAGQRQVVDAFLAAIRSRDLQALVAILDPEIVVRTDAASPNLPRELRGTERVAPAILATARGARFARAVMLDGAVGVVIAPKGRLRVALRFTTANGKITSIEAINDRERLRDMEIAVLDR